MRSRCDGARSALPVSAARLPGLVMIVALSALFLAARPPLLVLGAAAGAGAAVPAVAVQAAWGLAPASWGRMQAGTVRAARSRWIGCALLGGTAAALAWEAFKVGALSYGGGFVIIPLMQHDAVHTYHWMTNAQFLDAVALGQVTPGPVVLTTAVAGFAAARYAGALLAVAVAFSPSFVFILLGAPRFDALRGNLRIQAFLTGAGPSVIGAIAGSAIPLALALGHRWQYVLLSAAALWLLAARRGVVSALLLASVCGLIAAAAGLPVG